MGVERQANLDIGFTVNYWEPRSITVDLVGGIVTAVFTPFRDRALYEAAGHDAGIQGESRRVTFPLYGRDASNVQALRDWVCRQAVDRLPVLYGASSDTGAPVTTQPDTTPPHEVANLALVPGDRQITATWEDPTDSDFSHVLVDGRKAEVVYAETGLASPGQWTEFTGTVDPAGTVIPVPENDIVYEIRLRTVDADGNISNGAIAEATPTAA